jgi:hypothetical protein
VLALGMHGKSLAHAVVMGYQGMRHFVVRGEMIGAGVLVVLSVALLPLAPAKPTSVNQVAP